MNYVFRVFAPVILLLIMLTACGEMSNDSSISNDGLQKKSTVNKYPGIKIYKPEHFSSKFTPGSFNRNVSIEQNETAMQLLANSNVLSDSKGSSKKSAVQGGKDKKGKGHGDNDKHHDGKHNDSDDDDFDCGCGKDGKKHDYKPKKGKGHWENDDHHGGKHNDSDDDCDCCDDDDDGDKDHNGKGKDHDKKSKKGKGHWENDDHHGGKHNGSGGNCGDDDDDEEEDGGVNYDVIDLGTILSSYTLTESQVADLATYQQDYLNCITLVLEQLAVREQEIIDAANAEIESIRLRYCNGELTKCEACALIKTVNEEAALAIQALSATDEFTACICEYVNTVSLIFSGVDREEFIDWFFTNYPTYNCQFDDEEPPPTED